MMVADSENSVEELSSTDLQRIISAFCDCNYTYKAPVPEPIILPDFLVPERSNYSKKVTANIIETKNNFLQTYDNINKAIEDMAYQAIFNIWVRKEELQRELQVIGTQSVNKWNRQINALRQFDDLKYIIQYYSSNYSYNYLDSDKAKHEEELDFIDSGDLEFLLQDFRTFLINCRTLGTISRFIGPKSGSLKKFRSSAPKFIFGSSGSKTGQFCRPWGICTDALGRILVCDRSNHRVQIFDDSGNFVIEFGKEGSKAGEFNRPSGIDVDTKCRIIVADKDNHRIQIFTFSGHYLFEFGSQGSNPGQFQYPWDVSVNQNCQIAVSDSKNHRIQLFDENGGLLRIFDGTTIGIKGLSALKFFDSPRGLAFRPDGSLLVTDFNIHRIIIIAEDFRSFKTFGSEGCWSGQFFRPQGIACDKTGRIAVADSKNYRVQVFNNKWEIVRIFGSQGSKAGHFDCPQGICFHPNRNVLVVDLNNDRVQVF